MIPCIRKRIRIHWCQDTKSGSFINDRLGVSYPTLRPSPSAMGKAQPSPAVERFGNLELPLGSGIHRYVGVRKVRNGQFQGYTPKKTHTTKACSSAHEAAVLRAQEKFNVQNFGEATKRKRSAARKSRWEGKLLTCPLPSHTLRAHDFMWLDSCRAAGAFGCQEAQGRRDERVRDEPAAHSFAGVPDYTRAGGVALRVRPSARACRAHGMSIAPYNPGVFEHHPCTHRGAPIALRRSHIGSYWVRSPGGLFPRGPQAVPGGQEQCLCGLSRSMPMTGDYEL